MFASFVTTYFERYAFVRKNLNFRVKRKVSRKFGREAAKFGGLSRAALFSIDSMWFQTIKCASSNFSESHISSFWNFPKVSFKNLPTQIFLMGYIYFGFDLILVCATHTQSRCQYQILSYSTILFGMWFWNVLNVIELDRSWFFPFLDVKDHYLCTTLGKCALISEAVTPNEMLPKHHW